MSNKHVRHVGKKEKARRLAQIKKRAAAARKKAPKKRPVLQEPEPQEAQPKDPFSFPDGVTPEDHQRLVDARFAESEAFEFTINSVSNFEIPEDSELPRRLGVVENITEDSE